MAERNNSQDVASNSDPAPEAVSVEIYDQIYNLRGSDAEYIQQLAALVNAKMRAVASRGGTADSLRVAVLAALNIARSARCSTTSSKTAAPADRAGYRNGLWMVTVPNCWPC
jgi:cell division protein ZapA (FtsZ GTPase activity inhibitor)